MPKAYSYIRFSTPEQSQGDSFRRQIEASRRYAEEHGLELDDSLSFHDLGVSGYRGKNVADGALGAFLRAVDEGKIAQGSYLLVENLDRLSRDTVLSAFSLFTSILDRGINIVTLHDRRVFTKQSVNQQFGDLLISLTMMFRAHEESVTKGKRVGEAWRNKRERASQGDHKLTAQCPAWLHLDRDSGTFEVIEERADIVREIFTMTADGIGTKKIAETFNLRGVPTFGRSNGWQHSYIQKILQNDAVIGCFQPHRSEVGEDGRRRRVPDGEPIKDYFPAVVDRDLWLKAKASRSERRVPSGQRGKHVSNLFTGIAMCGLCGGPLHFVNKGKGETYLVCSNKRRGITKCSQKSWRYRKFEPAVLSYLREVDFAKLLPSIRSESTAAIEALARQKRAYEDDLEKTRTAIERLTDAVEQGQYSKALAMRLAAQEAREAEIEQDLKRTNQELEKHRRAVASVGERFEKTRDALVRWFFTTVTSDEERYRQRARMQTLLRENVERIEVFPVDAPPIMATIIIKFAGLEGITRVVKVWDGWRGAENYAAEPNGELIPELTVYHGEANPLLVAPDIIQYAPL